MTTHRSLAELDAGNRIRQATRPCIHPTCRDDDGNPRLTQDVMCYPCRAHYRRQLGWLIEDFVTLKTNFPHPIPERGAKRHGTTLSYGHPAEWASYTCAEIAGALYDAEDNLRAHLQDQPASAVTTEARKVNNAHQYISPRFDRFATFPDAQLHAEAIITLHASIRGTLQTGKLYLHLPMPCPTCDMLTLTQQTGQIVCGNESCGRVIQEREYPFLARIAADWALDDLVEQYDAQHADLT